jgi:ribonuclease P protein component
METTTKYSKSTRLEIYYLSVKLNLVTSYPSVYTSENNPNACRLINISMGKDYYAILSLPKDANGQVIKRAYRREAVKWHPDKNMDNKEAAEERFKEIAEAYDVLSDPQKRAVYDKYGEDGLKSGGGAPPPSEEFVAGAAQQPPHFNYRFNGDPHSVFANFFRDSFERSSSFAGDPFSQPDAFEELFGGRGLSGSVGQKRAMHADLTVSLEELYKGAVKRLRIKRTTRTAKREAEKILEVNVTPGWKAGTKITFAGEGDEIGNTGQYQDVIFVIREKKHPLFARDGSNLILKSDVPLKDALCGFTMEVPTLDSRVLRIKVDEVLTGGSTKIVKNEGMPISRQPGQRGDLIITFDVIFPKTLTPQQKQAIKQIL